MMAQRRLGIADIVVGQPIPWDVYDDARKLLLKKGQVVASERQVAMLVDQGLFVEAAPGPKEAPPKIVEASSVVRTLNAAEKRLERLLYNLPTETDVPTKIMDVAKSIFTSSAQNPDIALGCILLNQKSGNYAVRHCVDTAVLALIVARRMQKGVDELKALAAAALTMNVSILRQQDAFQTKTDALGEREHEVIKGHPEASVAMLKQAGVDNAEWLKYVLMHHEAMDGSGYPLGEKVGEIPQNVKILAMADHYCACVVQRKYRKSLLPHTALREILMPGGQPSDPLLAAYFIKEIGNYPPGTFVRLQTDEIGVVIHRGEHPSTPVVQALVNPRGVALSIPIRRDTAKPLFGVREAVVNDGKLLRFSLQQLWGTEAAL